MILITGGWGLSALHTARRFLDAGEKVVLTQYHVRREPDFIKDEIGRRSLHREIGCDQQSRCNRSCAQIQGHGHRPFGGSRLRSIIGGRGSPRQHDGIA